MSQAATDMEGQGSRPRILRWTIVGTLVASAMVLTTLAGWRDRHAVLINVSDSLPNWAFLVDRGRLPARGDYLFFLPPQSALIRRHFGRRPHLFGKIAFGMPGDLVEHRGLDVAINGAVVARMKPYSRLGEPLTPGATGRVPAGCYFAGTPHPDGFDSRYAEIGFVCAGQILGTGVPVL